MFETENDKNQIARIRDELDGRSYKNIVELCALYKCHVGDLLRMMAKARGMKYADIKIAKKNEDIPERNLARASFCLAVKYLEEKIRSDKVIEGLLRDIVGRDIKIIVEHKRGKQ